MIQTLNIDYTDKGELSGPGSDFEQDSEKDRNKLEKKMDNIKDRYVCMYVCMYVFSWFFNYKWDVNNYGLKTTGLMDPGGNYPSTLNNTRLYPSMCTLIDFSNFSAITHYFRDTVLNCLI